MINLDLSTLKDLEWYAYALTGFCLGIYIHSHHVRHWIHLLIISILRGFIWIFQRTDPRYKEPRPIPQIKQPIQSKRQSGHSISHDELIQMLKDNPDLSITTQN